MTKTRDISDLYLMHGASLLFLVHEARRRGLDWKSGLPGINIDSGNFPLLMPLADYVRFAGYLTELSGDPAFYFSSFINYEAPENYEEPAMIVLHMPTLQHSYRLGVFAANTYLNFVHIDILYGRNMCCHTFYFPDKSGDMKKFLCENYVVNIYQILKYYTAGRGRFDRIEFPFSRPSWHDLITGYFDCPVQYVPGSPRVNIYIPSRYLEYTNPFSSRGQASPLTLAYLVKKAHKEWRNACFGGLSGRVNREIWQRIREGGTPEIGDIAAALDMHPRQLQRELQEENSSFRQILGRVRLKRSLRLLLDEKFSLETVASSSGFDSPAGLHQFYRNLAGKTPLEIREEYTDTMPRAE